MELLVLAQEQACGAEFLPGLLVQKIEVGGRRAPLLADVYNRTNEGIADRGCVRTRGQQAAAGDGSERNSAQELGIVMAAGAVQGRSSNAAAWATGRRQRRSER